MLGTFIPYMMAQCERKSFRIDQRASDIAYIHILLSYTPFFEQVLPQLRFTRYSKIELMVLNFLVLGGWSFPIALSVLPSFTFTSNT
jgi:hypothetical protein